MVTVLLHFQFKYMFVKDKITVNLQFLNDGITILLLQIKNWIDHYCSILFRGLAIKELVRPLVTGANISKADVDIVQILLGVSLLTLLVLLLFHIGAFATGG